MQIKHETDFQQDDINTLRTRLDIFNQVYVRHEERRTIFISLRDDDGQLRGGLVGETHWNWFHILILWVDDPLREQGYGEQLLQMAEADAFEKGCLHVYLDLIDFQTPRFYIQHGYVVFGELADFPPGHTRRFMRKTLPTPG